MVALRVYHFHLSFVSKAYTSIYDAAASLFPRKRWVLFCDNSKISLSSKTKSSFAWSRRCSGAI